jgi:hypothetical protein
MRDPECSATLAETSERLRRRTFPVDYVSVIGQPDPRAGWPMEQVAAFLKVHASINLGAFVRVDIDMLEAPASDAHRAANARVLSEIPPPFTVDLDMDQNCSPDGDGVLRWTDTIHAQRSDGIGVVDDDGLTRPRFEPYEVGAAAGGVPLEVGSTKASVTLWHLARSRGVARWPYGSTVLTVLLDTTRHHPSLDSSGLTSLDRCVDLRTPIEE